MKPRSNKETILDDPPVARISSAKVFPPVNNNGEMEERLLAVASWDGNLSVYDFKANVLLFREMYEEHRFPVLGIAPVGPTSLCFGGLDKNVYLLKDFPTDPEALSVKKPSPVILGFHVGSVTSVEYSQESNLVISGCRKGDIIMWKWEEEAQGPVDVIKTGRPGIFCLSVRGNLIAAGLAGGEVGIWDIRNTENPVKILKLKNNLHLECLALSPDTKRFVYGTAEGKASCVTISDEDEDSHGSFVFNAHFDKARALGHPVNAVCFFDQSSRFFTAGSDGKCHMWDHDSARHIMGFTPYPNEVACLHASSCGNYLVIACSYLDDRELAPGVKAPPNAIFIRNISLLVQTKD